MPLQRVGDVELFYELIDYTAPWRAGPAPVVFIHGLGGDHRAWLPQIPVFAAEFPVLAVDLRGHGRSSPAAAELTIADLARDLVRLLRAQGVERAHVVGLSLGGMVALQLGLDCPGEAASLVLADTWCGCPAGFEDVMRSGLQFIEENPMPVVAKSRITAAFSDAVDPAMRDYLIDQISGNDKPSYDRVARATFGFAVRERLHEVAVPTLVVCGEADRVTPVPLSEELAHGIAGARLVRIPDAGHIANLERPQAFNRVVLEFLRAVSKEENHGLRA